MGLGCQDVIPLIQLEQPIAMRCSVCCDVGRRATLETVTQLSWMRQRPIKLHDRGWIAWPHNAFKVYPARESHVEDVNSLSLH